MSTRSETAPPTGVVPITKPIIRNNMHPVRYLTVAFLLAATLSAAPSGFEANIPFAFRAGERDLPPGTYSFLTSESNVRIRGAQSDVRLTVKSRLRGPSTRPAFEGMLGFDRKDTLRVLSEIWVPEGGGWLVGGLDGADAHVQVPVLSQPPEGLSGKNLFMQTCQVCHGRDGRGDAKADAFYSRALPRLDSAYVQAKSDEELREIITHGRNAMDPVRMQDDKGARHALPPYAVDPLIAHLRTLAGSR
jgi:mono/diheme cytochrome c family protein